MKDAALLKFPEELVPVTPALNDFEIDGHDLLLLEGPDRRKQDIAKILVTALGSNPITPTYGSPLPDTIGERDSQELLGQINDGVIQAMAFLDRVDKSTRLDEKIKSITLDVQEDPADKRSKIIILAVTLGNGQVVTTSTKV